MRRLVKWIGLLFALSPVLASGQTRQLTPTFDCAKASGQVEELICSDSGLANLDRRLDEVYAAAVKTWPEEVAAEQRAYQRGWIGGRNDCWKSDDVRACTELSYRTRIAELQIKSGQLMVPTPVGYACTGGDEKPFFATFYQETDPPSAVISYGGDQVIAFVAPSGSGTRYTAANVEFWEHQGEASIDWFGTRLTCRPRTAGGGDAPARPSLGGTTWLLVQFQSMDDTTLKPEAKVRYALTFGNDGSLQVQSGCNRGRGTWKSEDNTSLEFGPVALTRAACPPSPLQGRFVRDLDFVRSYIVADGHLHLSLMADGGIYEFEPLIAESAPLQTPSR